MGMESGVVAVAVVLVVAAVVVATAALVKMVVVNGPYRYRSSWCTTGDGSWFQLATYLSK